MDVLINAFVVLFVVVDPIAIAPMYLSFTHNNTAQQRKQMAIKGVFLATGMLLVFYLFGEWLLTVMGISIPAFRIAGGILLMLIAIDMILVYQSPIRSTTDVEQHEAELKQDISVFPLAFPLLSGPGALTTVLLMASNTPDRIHMAMMVGIIVVIMLLTLITLLLAPRVMKIVGETGTNVISRLFGLVLAALAVQYIIDGIKTAFFNS
jgi:multiple antibiotic resistance protein